MPYVSITAWNVTKNQPLVGAKAVMVGREAYTNSQGIADLGLWGVGEYPVTVTPTPGFTPPLETYLFNIVETNVSHLFNFEESGELPGPTPGVGGTPSATYKGVDIYEDTATSTFYFTFGGIGYTGFNFVADAEAKIDELTAPPTPTPTPEPIPDTVAPAPSNLGWLQGIADWFGNLTKWAVTQISTPFSGIGSAISLAYTHLGGKLDDQAVASNAINSTLNKVGGAVADGISAKTNEIVQRAISEALASVQVSLPGAVGDSPDWKINIENTLNPYANQIVAAIHSEVNPANFAHSPITPEEAKNALNTMEAGILAVEIGIFIANAALEGATLGQVEAIKELETLVISKLGLTTIASAAVTIPLNELVLKKAQQYYAAQYTPEIPGYGDLINMLVKEKISREDFTQNFAYLGFEKKWADLIWDAHFSAPGLNDVLTAWRRGEITEERVDELMVLVDLDPFYKQIFDTRKYVDPSLSLARFMFETGSIDEARVKEIVHRNGFRPDDEESLTNFVVHFQERRYRQRYLTALGTGYARGVVTVDELNKAVLDAGYSQGTADWIVKSSDIRKEIASRGTTATGPKLLAIGDLKKAYVNSIMDENTLRTELQLRDYQTTDIQTLIDVLNLDKEEAVVGKRVIALSPTEMLNAFRYGVWSEDQLRTELMVRGLSLDEVNTLIATKKAQWGVSP